MKNAQLWKRILNEGFTNLLDESMLPEEWDNEVILSHIITAPIIVAKGAHPSGKPDMSWSDYENMPIAMPFSKFWLEMPCDCSPECHEQYGVYFTNERTESGGFQIEAISFDLMPTTTNKKSPNRCAIVGALRFNLDSKGILPGGDAFDVSYCPMDRQKIYRESMSEEWLENMARRPVMRAMIALTTLSCKNVSLKSHDNDPQQVRRAMKRFGGNPDSYRYHTLIVRPPGAKSGSPGIEIGAMPRHVCRGHFAEYGPQFGKGLLFGKYEGRFFVPPHLKGDKKNGVVEKDYEVRP